jgi:hypothetical protein
MQKSCKFLPEIMAPVSSANIMGTDEVFSVERGHLHRIGKAKALKLFPSLNRYFGLNLMILFQYFNFC